jgi:hypothetical protein
MIKSRRRGRLVIAGIRSPIASLGARGVRAGSTESDVTIACSTQAIVVNIPPNR